MGMVRSSRPAALRALFAALAVLAPSVAAADPTPSDVDAAREHYRRGVHLYEGRRYADALVELQRAESLAPTYRLHYDIALVQRELGDAAGALRSFGAYLDAGPEVPAARRAEVERAIGELTARVATVGVTANVEGVEIAVDDRVTGTTPLAAPLHVNAGSHRVTAGKAGYAPATKTIDVRAGERLELPFALDPVAPPAAPPAPVRTQAEPTPPAPAVPEPPPPLVLTPAPPPVPPSHRRPPVWLGWTATGVLAAGAVGTGIAALAASGTLHGEVVDHATPPDAIHTQHSTTVALAAVTDVLTGAAALAAGVTLYVTFAFRGGASPGPAAEGAERTVPAGRLRVGAAPGGVWLRTTF
jgi:hypothetical protein